MAYQTPKMEDPIDALAHCLSEIIDDAAPIGWEKHRGTAKCLLGIFELRARSEKDQWIKDKYGETFPLTAPPVGDDIREAVRAELCEYGCDVLAAGDLSDVEKVTDRILALRGGGQP
jgi:hypothetical protein